MEILIGAAIVAVVALAYLLFRRQSKSGDGPGYMPGRGGGKGPIER